MKEELPIGGCADEKEQMTKTKEVFNVTPSS